VQDYPENMPDLDKVLANNMRSIRQSLRMTQEEFAEALGITQGGVSRMETGASWQRFKQLGDQLNTIGADPADLLHQAETGPGDAISAEIRALLPAVDEDVRKMILGMLRKLAGVSEIEKQRSARQQG
jgi:transcriptional regulator with XRE-family HTH domain